MYLWLDLDYCTYIVKNLMSNYSSADEYAINVYILPTLSECAGATERLFVRLFISAEQLTFFTAGGPHWKDTSFRDHCKGKNYVRRQHMSKGYSNKSHAPQNQFSLNEQNTPSMRYNVSLLYVFLNRGIKNHLVTTNYNWWMNHLMSWKSARAHIQMIKPLHYSTSLCSLWPQLLSRNVELG